MTEGFIRAQASMQYLPLVFAIMIAVIVGIVVLDAVTNDLDKAIDECESSGGNATTISDMSLLYCVYDNGTAKPLGSDKTPSEIDD